MELLKSLQPADLRTRFEQMGLPGYRADQVLQWMWRHGVESFEAMTNLPAALRATLAERAAVGGLELLKLRESADGTLKCLFATGREGSPPVEAVLIPDFFPDGAANRLTVCVSSQVGCLFGCAFCATGRMGFFRNLEAWEIADQIRILNGIAQERFGKRITNVVYMGMGEPLNNLQAVLHSVDLLTHQHAIGLSPRRITVSTVGLAKQIRQIAQAGAEFNLAVSLHAADDEKRNRIMPINRTLDLEALEGALRHYHALRGKPVTYEYLLFDSFNDQPDDARRLAAITRWVPSKVNIIMYNRVAGVELQRAREGRLDAFLRVLVTEGVRATVRRSRGDDIDAGCGQLAIREGVPQGRTIAGREKG